MTVQQPDDSADPQIAATIREFIVTELGWEGEPDDLLAEPPPHLPEMLDSQDLLELAGFLEEQFDIEIDDDEIVLANFSTVPDVVRLVARKATGTTG